MERQIFEKKWQREKENLKEPRKKFWSIGIQDNKKTDNYYRFDEDDEIANDKEWVVMENNAFNMRLVNLNNFSLVNTNSSKSSHRVHSIAHIKASRGINQNAAKSLDLLRQVLQDTIDSQINSLIQKYIAKYFMPALVNIKLNNGSEDVGDEHIAYVSQQILEEAKKMYIVGDCGNTDISYNSDNMSECGSLDNDTNRIKVSKRIGTRKRTFSSGSDLPLMIKAKVSHKRGRIPNHLKVSSLSGRSTPIQNKNLEPVKKEAPKWEPERITTETLFVMGSKANRAIGYGLNRGKLYIKYPELFKYGGDQEDKQWLYENMNMPITGGRTYLLILEDIKELVQLEEYKNCPGITVNELEGFKVPSWMIKKMKLLMALQRTDTSVNSTKNYQNVTDNSFNKKDLSLNDTNISQQKIVIAFEKTDVMFQNRYLDMNLDGILMNERVDALNNETFNVNELNNISVINNNNNNINKNYVNSNNNNINSLITSSANNNNIINIIEVNKSQEKNNNIYNTNEFTSNNNIYNNDNIINKNNYFIINKNDNLSDNITVNYDSYLSSNKTNINNSLKDENNEEFNSMDNDNDNNNNDDLETEEESTPL